MHTPRVTLVVDDDPLVRELLVASIGRATVTADGVEQARRALRDHRVACVISDLNLQDGDGIAVLLAARELQPWARRWLITGKPDERTAQAVATTLAEGVLPKPWNLAALRAVAR